jgi:hypothetical protein
MNTKITNVEELKNKPSKEIDFSAMDIITQIERGFFLEQISMESKEVVKGCMMNMKKGKLVIEINFDPDPKTETMRITGKHKATIPTPTPRASLFFPDEDGNLSRSDYRQPMMFPEER